MSEAPEVVPLGRLEPHPDNPRMYLRDAVVEQLAAEMARDGFGPEHAILVRPVPEGWQIVSGHHRVEAARMAGLTEIPCWVKDLDDAEAFMQLVLSNTQGELSPLEIGMHALRAVPRAQGRAGAGLAAYAERIGITPAYVGQIRSAAEVMTSLLNSSLEVLDKAKHFYEVSKAPRAVWDQLVAAMLAGGWTVADTAHHVRAIDELRVPEPHAAWLPLADLVREQLARPDRMTGRTVLRLTSAADDVLAYLVDDEPASAAFMEWLAAGVGSTSWDHRQIVAYHQRLIAERFVVPGWHQGSWADHIDKLDDGTVSLVLTDPPYGQGFQSDYRTDRREERRHEPIVGDDTDAAVELTAALEALQPKLADDAHLLVETIGLTIQTTGCARTSPICLVVPLPAVTATRGVTVGRSRPRCATGRPIDTSGRSSISGGER